MDFLSNRFSDTNSKSTSKDSTSPCKTEPVILQENEAKEQNQSIAPIFGKENLVTCYLESVTLQNNNLLLLQSYKTILRSDHKSIVECVKVLSGGATAADPLYSGSIGRGMLTGAVFGELNKSPPSLTILEVLRIMSIKNKQGILVIVSNNLANRLNFGSACQSAAQEGIKTLLVSVGEDVSGVCVSKTIGRRGLCGIKFLFKVAGAMSEEKKSLYEIYQTIEKLKGSSLGTISVQIRPDTMVLGCGCKGESDKLFFRWDTFDDCGDKARITFIVEQALSHLFHPSSYFSLQITKRDQIAIIVNNLGSLSDFHFSLIIKEILDQMKILDLAVRRLYTGRYLNSDSSGFSISVLKLNDNILELLDYPANVTAWTDKFCIINANMEPEPRIILNTPSATPISFTSILSDKQCMGPKFTSKQAAYLLDVLSNIVETVKNMEEYLNKLDKDHDFGTAVSKFASAIKMVIENRSLKIVSPFEFLDQMAYLSGFSMGGVAGGIFTIIFSSAAQVFLSAPPKGSVDMRMWVEAAKAARDGLQRFTRVQPGYGTILDALDPFVESTTEYSVKGLSKRVSAALRGAEDSTRKSRATTRASVGSTEGGDGGMPDAGALCLAAVIQTIFTSLQMDLMESEAVRRKRDVPQSMGQGINLTTDDEENENEYEGKLTREESKHTCSINDQVCQSTETTLNQSHLLVENKSEHLHTCNIKDQVFQSTESTSNQSHLVENQSEHLHQLKTVFEDITKEIENEVLNDNN